MYISRKFDAREVQAKIQCRLMEARWWTTG